MEAPEKIYVHVKRNKVTNTWNSTFIGVRDIEYTRTDAFIEKACKYISLHQCEYIDFEDFKNYMEDNYEAINKRTGNILC